MEDDPVIASYNVYMTGPPSGQHDKAPKYYVLQYPSHRPSTKLYDASRGQKPLSLRVKPNTNLFEIDVPIITSDNYNADLAKHLGRSMNTSSSRTMPSYGLSGGFSTNHAPQHVNLDDLPVYGEEEALKTQVLGGKVAASTDKDPVYMLAAMKNDEIHLTHLDGVVQMRPQLHHLDAAEEAKRKADTAGKTKQPLDGMPTKLETKAIEMKIKDSKEDPKDRSLNANAQLLRDIQADKWVKHEWLDESDSNGTINTSTQDLSARRLTAAINNDEWLDKMSSPSNELRQRLKGRDRERARRKRQERQRSGKSARANVLPAEEAVESDSDVESEDNNAMEQGVVSSVDRPVQRRASTHMPQSPEARIKQEAGTSDMLPPSTSPTTARKRGRPKKT